MRYLLAFIMLSLLFSFPIMASAKEELDIDAKRMELYKRVEAITHIPWYYMAAIDQYERSVRNARKDLPDAEGLSGIYFKPEEWTGILNPNHEDSNPLSIQFFDGLGFDGNGDGKADIHDDEDVLHAFAQILLGYGTDQENIKIGLWDYYQRDKTVGIIMDKAKIYQKFGRLDLNEHAFPVPLRSNHSYKNTWGDARGWGGRRIHEGTDIFADYGVPVRATGYGVIEMKGWNRYGGWRVGIRDINNTYHYFAHLSGFAKDLKVGQIVEPGQVIGGVGSSGYGPPGTSGKFPPHLHYGMYKDNGYTEWSFDPYPHLRLWAKEERARLQKQK
ncbi:M23 family metallopeptidase [Mesobacillus maritimus]|uniref:M23 family metallopeptidase n=1 Tax=Mesobacillus maritimus TaxID=1643336 RepID=UPI00203DDB16|nr:M23 family metallopeptidase [Mesobacillus maritimus]MCM3670261.1 M23 family metallopeptidase [Mesobacillus maritimus]